MAFDIKQKLKIELFEVCRIVALFHNREKERERQRETERAMHWCLASSML